VEAAQYAGHAPRLLARSGLVRGTRDGKSIRYRADIEGMRALIGFLVIDCATDIRICAASKTLQRRMAAVARRRSMATNAGVIHVRTIAASKPSTSVSLYRKLRAIDHRRGDHETAKAAEIFAHSRGQPAERKSAPLYDRSAARMNFDTSGFRSKSWSEFQRFRGAKARFRFPVCDQAAAESCPFWPGSR